MTPLISIKTNIELDIVSTACILATYHGRSEMTYQQAREYLANHLRSDCPMTYDAAFELVSYSDNMTDEPVRINGRGRWGG